MIDLSKSEYRIAKEVLRTGILRLHENWQKDLAELLARPYDNDRENAFDRSMEIISMTNKWKKEAYAMERWYSKSAIIYNISILLDEGILTEADIAPLSDEVKKDIAIFNSK